MIIKNNSQIQSYLEDTSNIKGSAEYLYIPQSCQELKSCINDLIKIKTAFTISAGRTGTTGGCVPQSGVIVSLENLNKIISIDSQAKTVVLEAGVSLESLELAANKQGLSFRACPTESLALIGGAISTAASGVRGFGYGSIRKYVRKIENGRPNGQGTLTNPNGYTYTGKWKDGEKNGRGTETYSNQDKYTGEFKDGEKHGQGLFTSADGYKYVGKFKDGKKHGQGTLTTPDRDRYVGKFWHGKKHGQGTLYTSNGDKYVGKFYHGEKHVQGTETWSDGDMYEGEYKNGD